MRRQQHAVEPAQRRVGRQRLDREDVDRRTADALLLHRFRQGHFVHELTARGVDQHSRRLHEPQAIRVDQVMCLVSQRHMQRHHVGGAEQILERKERHAHLRRSLGEEIRVVRHDAHPEGACQLGDVRADAAQPHDAHGLSAQLRAFELLAVPTPTPHRRGRLGNPPHQREQQAEGVLAGADGVGAGGVHDGDATPGGRGDVDRVDARPRARHDPHVGGSGQDVGGHTGFTADDQRVRAGERAIELFLGLPGHGHDLDVRCGGEQLEAALRNAIGDNDAPGHGANRVRRE